MSLYLFALALAGQATVHYAVKAFKNRQYGGFCEFAVLQLSIAFWIVCYIGEQTAGSGSTFWFYLKFLGIGLVAPSWLLYVIARTTDRARVHRARYWVYSWAFVLPAISLTNEQHRWFFDRLVFHNEIIGINGPLFYVHVLYNYALLGVSLVLLIRHLVRVPSHRANTWALVLASLLPWIASIANEYGKDLVRSTSLFPVNPTLPAFVVTSLVFGWAVFKGRLLDPKPLAREKLFEVQSDALWVLDENGTVVDLNPCALEYWNDPTRSPLGTSLSSWSEPWKSLDLSRLPQDFRAYGAGGTKYVHASATELQDAQGRRRGTLVSARDVTRMKMLESEIDRHHKNRVLAEFKISDREAQILEYANRGLSNKEISSELGIEFSTVKNHLSSIFKKMNARSRVDVLKRFNKSYLDR